MSFSWVLTKEFDDAFQEYLEEIKLKPCANPTLPGPKEEAFHDHLLAGRFNHSGSPFRNDDGISGEHLYYAYKLMTNGPKRVMSTNRYEFELGNKITRWLQEGKTFDEVKGELATLKVSHGKT